MHLSKQDQRLYEAIRGMADPLKARQAIDECSSRLRNLLMSKFGNKSDIDDAIGQTWAIATQRIDQFEGRGSLEGWLRTTAFNAMRNLMVRGTFRGGMTNSFDGEHPPEVIDTHAEDPLDQLIEQDEREHIQGHVDALPEASRMMLLLHYYQDKMYKEVGEALNIPVGTVKSRMFRAHASLRVRLKRTDPSQR